MSGPAGAGKTAAVKILAHEMNSEIVEWREGHSGKVVDGDTGTEFFFEPTEAYSADSLLCG